MTVFFKFLLSVVVLIIFITVDTSLAASTPCKSDTFDSLPEIHLALLTKGFNQPVQLTHAGDNSRRIFVTEQAGTIRILKDGSIMPKPFFDIREKVNSGGEKGLLSVAFHPYFEKNGRFFVNYTSSKGFFGLQTIVSEFYARPESNEADEESEKIILEIVQPYSNHNGGQIAFGPDGYLYIGMGDGGAGNDPQGNGQNLSTLLGAILRIDIDNKQGKNNYAIPQDNPFKTRLSARPEIFAYGLRNPWRFSFDQLTGVLYAGDVGQNAREEIDIIESGNNYGWNIMEGSICTPGVNPDCISKGLAPPIIDYGRTEGITVIGGYVYRGRKIPALCGSYIYGDFGSGNIWAMYYNDKKVVWNKLLLRTELSISSFGIDEDHEIYVVDYGGSIYKIRVK